MKLNNSKTISIFLLLALAAFIITLSLIGYIQIAGYGTKESGGEVTLVITVFNDSESNMYKFTNMTALKLLELNNKVNTTSSKFGDFINCINDICSTSDYYWLYYVNNELAAVSASEYKVKNNDTIEFRYGKIE